MELATHPTIRIYPGGEYGIDENADCPITVHFYRYGLISLEQDHRSDITIHKDHLMYIVKEINKVLPEVDQYYKNH